VDSNSPAEVVQQIVGKEFNPKEDAEDMAVASDFKRFLTNLGYKADELNSAHPRNAQNRQFLAKLWPSDNEGRWQINFSYIGMKPMPEVGSEEYNAIMAMAAGGSAEGLNGFSKGGAKKMTPEEALAAELAEGS